MKIIFAGSSVFSEKHLQVLINSQYSILSVLTKPDHCYKTRNKVIYSPVKTLAQKFSIPILQPSSLNEEEFKKKLYSIKADIMIVASYGLIFNTTILNMFPLGCINIHTSLLPKWRGPSPIQQSILSGDKNTGITIIKMNEKIDSGDILYSMKCDISNHETTFSLTKKLIKLGTKSLLTILKKLSKKNVKLVQQNHLNATYCKLIKKNDAKINWFLTAEILDRQIRAYNPWPTSFFTVNNLKIKVWEASIINYDHIIKLCGKILLINQSGIQVQTNSKVLNIQKIQFPGRNIITIKDLINSKKKYFFSGMMLSS